MWPHLGPLSFYVTIPGETNDVANTINILSGIPSLSKLSGLSAVFGVGATVDQAVAAGQHLAPQGLLAEALDGGVDQRLVNGLGGQTEVGRLAVAAIGNLVVASGFLAAALLIAGAVLVWALGFLVFSIALPTPLASPRRSGTWTAGPARSARRPTPGPIWSISGRQRPTAIFR